MTIARVRAALLVFLLAIGFAQAATLVYFRGESGDPILQGRELTLAPPDLIVANTYVRGGVHVGLRGGTDFWSIDFAPPLGREFTPGYYAQAENVISGAVARPGLDFSGGWGCDVIGGAFTVHEVAWDSVGTVQKLAIDFMQRCGTAPAEYGIIRFNSDVPLIVDGPRASAGFLQNVEEGTAVALDGSFSADTGGSALSYRWAQISGPAVVLSDAAVARPTFVAPDVPPGGADLLFQLTVTNAAGKTDSDEVGVHVADPADPRTLLHFKSETGDYIGQGLERTFGTLDGTFSGVKNYRDGVTINFNGGLTRTWSLYFGPPLGEPFVAGTYSLAERFAFASPTRPGIDIDGEGRGCNRIAGNFVVHEVEFAADNYTVAKFAADFEQHCEGGAPALFGSIRYNSAVPVAADFVVSTPGSDQYVEEGASVALDGSASRDVNGAPLAFQWSQVAGPSVSIGDGTVARVSFTAPEVPPGGQDLVFRLRVSNAAGATGEADVTIHVADRADPKTSIYLNSQPGDWAGGGIEQTLTRADGNFTAQKNSRDGVTVRFNGPSFWMLEFGPPFGQPFVPGNYQDAQRFPFAAPGLPALSASGGGCNTLTGSFNVLEVEFGSAGEVLKFAADFEQHCEGQAPALFGAVRFNSTIPLISGIPMAAAGRDQTTEEGSVITLDGSRSRDPAGGPLSFHWSQVAGTPAALGSPDAAQTNVTIPEVPVGGQDLEFELTVTNAAGNSSTDRVVVHVPHRGDPRTFVEINSQPGDWIGRGEHHVYTSWEGTFNWRSVAGGVWFTFSSNYDGLELDFTPITGQVLAPGTYLAAGRYATADRPGLEVTRWPAGCNIVVGQFTVLELVFDAGGALQKFAADFEQHCDGMEPALFGGIRFNSTLPYNPGPPPTRLEIVGSSSFLALGGTAVSERFVVRVLDTLSRPVAGVPVTYNTTRGCGTWGGALTTTVNTQNDGTAFPPEFIADLSGSCEVTASSPDAIEPAVFEVRIVGLSDLAFTLIPGTTVHSTVNEVYLVGVTARFLGEGVAGIPVTFQVQPANGAGATLVSTTPITYGEGTALASFRANGVAGNYSIRISLGGASFDIAVVQAAAETPPPPPPAGPRVDRVQDMWWAGPDENGWGMSIVKHRDIIFGVIYAYDSLGNPTWFVMPEGTWDATHSIYTGPLYSPRGSPYYGYETSRFIPGDPVGTISISFSGDRNAVLDYVINGQSGHKEITRQLFGPGRGPTANPLTDMWWGGPSQNGWGIAVIQQYAKLFSVWFTYDDSGLPTWFVMPDGTWTSEHRYQGRIYQTTSSAWLGQDYDPSDLEVTDVGSFNLLFLGTGAVLDYTINGHVGRLELERQGF